MAQFKFLTAICLLILMAGCHSGKKIAAVDNKATANLQETYWKLTGLKLAPVSTPDNVKEIHIKFRKDDLKFQGFGGCNTLMGNYALTGQSAIKINAGSTRMFCDRMETENQLTKVLAETTRYTILHDTLQLHSTNILLATFQAVYF